MSLHRKQVMFCVVLYAFYIIASWGYRIVVVGDLEYTDDFRIRYSGLILTDSIEYYNYNKKNISSFTSLLNADVKNYVGPIIALRLMGDIKYGDLIINNILVLFSLMVVLEILRVKKEIKTFRFVLFLCNPMLVYYSQGYNKEIMVMLLLLLFLLFHIQRKRLLKYIIIVLMLLVRTQMSIFLVSCILVFVLLRHISFNISILFYAYLPAAIFFPFIYEKVSGVFFIASESYYGMSQGLGVGVVVLELLATYPLFSYIGLPIRALQNILEPVFGYRGNSPAQIAGIISTLFTAPYWLYLCLQCLLDIFHGKSIKGKYRYFEMYIICFVGLIFISLNPFIHSRYLFGFYPLLSFAVEKKPKSNIRLVTLDIS